MRALRYFFGMTTGGLEYGEVECWIRPAGRYWFKVVSNSLAKIGLTRWGRDVTGALTSRTEISKGIREQEPNQYWTWRKRQQNRKEHCPAVRLLNGSSPDREGRMQPHADVTAVVPRRTGMKGVVPGSNAQVRPARVRLWRAHMQEVKP